MTNPSLQIAVDHLTKAKKELKECADTIIEKLTPLQKSETAASEALLALQLQDIISQRLDKVESFLRHIDSMVELHSSQEYLDTFAWEKEVTQDDIDSLFDEK